MVRNLEKNSFPPGNVCKNWKELWIFCKKFIVNPEHAIMKITFRDMAAEIEAHEIVIVNIVYDIDFVKARVFDEICDTPTQTPGTLHKNHRTMREALMMIRLYDVDTLASLDEVFGLAIDLSQIKYGDC